MPQRGCARDTRAEGPVPDHLSRQYYGSCGLLDLHLRYAYRAVELILLLWGLTKVRNGSAEDFLLTEWHTSADEANKLSLPASHLTYDGASGNSRRIC